MVTFDINYWAVLVAAVVSFLAGWLWYSKSLFGKAWTKLQGVTEKQMQEAHKKAMGPKMLAGFLSTVVMSFVMAHVVDAFAAETVASGLQAGFWMWLGFVAPVMLGMVLWQDKSFKLYLIDVGHYLVALLIMGVILAAWI